MVQHELPYDGFVVREDRGFRIRSNVDHIQQCCIAIRKRWAMESQHTTTHDNVVDLTQAKRRASV